MLRILRNGISEKLKDKYKLYTKEYGEDNIVGIYACGTPVYGNCKSINEVAWVIIYRLPAIHMLRFSDPIEYEPLEETDFLFSVEDYFKLLKENPYYLLETLCTSLFCENPKYKEILKNLKLEVNKIYFCNLSDKIKEEQKTALYFLDSYAENKNSDFLKEAIRINYFLQKLKNNKNYKEALILDENILSFWLNPGNRKASNLNILKIRESIENFSIPNLGVDEEVEKEKIKTLILDFWREKPIAKVTEEDLESLIKQVKLTEKEKQALKAVLEEVPESTGTIVLRDLVEKTGISRPVFRNMLHKIDNFIIFKNLGYKGSSITFLNKKLCEDFLN